MAALSRVLLGVSAHLCRQAPLAHQPTAALSPVALQLRHFGHERIKNPRTKEEVEEQLKRRDGHQASKQRPCPICSNNIVVDYKDVKLLSNFVSPTSGAILRRSATGVCPQQQHKITKAIKTARNFGLMPVISRHSLLKDEEGK